MPTRDEKQEMFDCLMQTKDGQERLINALKYWFVGGGDQLYAMLELRNFLSKYPEDIRQQIFNRVL